MRHVHAQKSARGKKWVCLSTGCMCEWISQPSARRGRGTNEGRLSCLSRASYFSFPAYGRDNKTCSIYVNWQRASPVNRHAPKILPGNLEARSPPAHARFILHQPPQHACEWLVSWPKACGAWTPPVPYSQQSSVPPVRDANEAIHEWWALGRTSDSTIMRGSAGRGTNDR